jgi:hypothetical protein
MAIEFACERCGHRIEVEDRFEGKHGKCKHCGHHLTVPDHHDAHERAPANASTDDDPSLHLRPVEAEPPPAAAELLAPHSPLKVRPADGLPDDDRRPKPTMVSDPDSPPLASPSRSRWRGFRRKTVSGEYAVLDPYKAEQTHSAAGPPPLLFNLPTLTARFLAGQFRSFRDWLYVVSVASLVVVLYGYIFGAKRVMHLAIIAVIASNITMLVVGFAYLVMIPFKDSMVTGLANLFPPYAVYYWIKHWHKMRRPVLKTLGSFVPILLAGLAYFLYEDAPLLEKKLPEIEKKLENKLDGLGKGLDRRLGLPKEYSTEETPPAEKAGDEPAPKAKGEAEKAPSGNKPF